jgi:hypothetical protein
MVTSEEIEQRVEEADAIRSARRTIAAKRVGELAQRQAIEAEKLAETERELGEVLAECSAVIGIDELAKFTGVSVADLNHWQSMRKPTRPRRKRATATPPRGAPSQPLSTAATSPRGQAPAPMKAVLAPTGSGESTTVMR